LSGQLIGVVCRPPTLEGPEPFTDVIGSPAMSVDPPASIQILLAWRGTKWVVSRDAVDVGAYAYKNHAMDTVRRLAAEARAEGLDCSLLVRERDGAWRERPGPGAARRRGGARGKEPQDE
jgi:hypothetical protein